MSDLYTMTNLTYMLKRLLSVSMKATEPATHGTPDDHKLCHFKHHRMHLLFISTQGRKKGVVRFRLQT